MKEQGLKNVYDSEKFRERGHRLIDQLADHLEDKTTEKSHRAIHWNTPDEELRFWKDFLKNGEVDSMFSNMIARTTYVHHPHYIGHQVSPTAPLTALSGMISSLLNNGMAIYEMGMAPSAIERVVTDILCKKIGFDTNARGFLTSGGTLANLTALLSARKAKISHDVWNEGNSQQLGILVSEEAHYCVDRAAKIMGLGEQGIIKIPATDGYEMDVSQLESSYRNALKKGIHVFAIVGSAPSTATGVYDDLDAIAAFSEKYDLWFHVDGAHGGAAIFSEKYAHTVSGIDQADSVVIDGHKMMMMPTITTALLMRDGKNANATFSQKADYLLTHEDHEDWYNSGKRTFECTKNMMSIHWYSMLKLYGESIFDDYLTRLYDMGRLFGEMIEKETDFELAVTPVSNIVCFRYIDPVMEMQDLNALNEKIRQKLLEDGTFYIVQTKLRTVHYLRTTIMNPLTTYAHLSLLLETIRKLATTILKE